jgi:hypothetical protein
MKTNTDHLVKPDGQGTLTEQGKSWGRVLKVGAVFVIRAYRLFPGPFELQTLAAAYRYCFHQH